MPSERAAALRALFAVVFAAYVGHQIAGDRASAEVASITYVVVLIASVVLHELAHAVVAKVCGAEVLGMRLGFGPRLTPASSRLDLRPLVVAGHVSYSMPAGFSHRRQAAITGAGLFVHAALCLLALSLGSGAWPVWRIDLLVANVGALLSNAIPQQGSLTTTAGNGNDGAKLAGLLRRREPPLVEQAVSALAEGRLAEAEELAARALQAPAEADDRARALSALGWSMLAQGRHAEAQAALLQAMVLAPAEPLTQAFTAAFAATPAPRPGV